MDEITIRDLLRMIGKWLAWILVIPLIISTIVAVYSYAYQNDVYTAETKLFVLLDYKDNLGNIRYDAATSSQFVGDYKELIKTRTVLQRTCDRMGIEEFPQDLKIDISGISGTRILWVRVTSQDPQFAQAVANNISSVFVEYIQEITKVESISIAENAALPERPSGPARERNTLLTFFASILLCMGIAVAAELMNTTVRSDAEIESLLGIPVLTRIQGYQKEFEAFTQQGQGKGRGFYRCISDATRENIKTLWLNIQFASMSAKLKTLAVTSTINNEGKSSVVAMLASAAAAEGKRVLVVDMDFRSPTAGRLLGCRGKHDMIDFLSGHNKLDEVIVPTPVPNIALIDSHHRTAAVARIVQTEAFSWLVKEVSRRFDLVLFDTPPLSIFIDAAVVSPKVDGVMLVVGNGVVDRQTIREAVDQLQKVNANILGAAFNFVQHRKHSSSYYYYYGGKGRRKAKAFNEDEGWGSAAEGEAN